MALAKDLLEQAQHLVSYDATRPKQANLRRAVSTAYYSLFHLLIAEAVHRLLQGRDALIMDRVSRAFQHGEMKQVCRQLQQHTLPEPLLTLFEGRISDKLRIVAESFNDLQEARHLADYDTSAKFSRTMAQAFVDTARQAFDAWYEVEEREARRFLAALAFAARWSK